MGASLTLLGLHLTQPLSLQRSTFFKKKKKSCVFLEEWSLVCFDLCLRLNCIWNVVG